MKQINVILDGGNAICKVDKEVRLILCMQQIVATRESLLSIETWMIFSSQREREILMYNNNNYLSTLVTIHVRRCCAMPTNQC